VSETISEKPPRVIALDFDGTLHAYERGWTGFEPEDPPTPGAREAVAELRAQGYLVVVFSCRALSTLGAMGIRSWLAKHDIAVDDVTGTKPHAELYVDDRGLRFGGSWEDTLAFARRPHRMRPWNAGDREVVA
jgi:hypothetical protein